MGENRSVVCTFYDTMRGVVISGTAKVAEFSNFEAAYNWLMSNDWYMSGTNSLHYLKRNGCTLHECRLVC